MLDVYEGERRTACLEMNGTITALTVTSDFKYFVACLSDRLEENFSIIVFNAQNDLQEDVSFSCEVAADVLRTDDSHETLIAFAPSKTRNTATIACYILQSGHKIAAVELDNHEKSDVWEITLCPTDEHIMCVLSSSTAYLLRNTGTVIQTFSSISLYGVTCHVWSTDVTMAFATQDGSILFYRETLALDKVDLSTTLKARLLSWVKLDDLMGVTFIDGYHLLVATSSSLQCYSVEYKTLAKRGVICSREIEKMSVTSCKKRCVIASKSGFTVIDISSNYLPVTEIDFDFASEIEFLEWNSTGTQIAIVTAKEYLFVFQYPSGNLLWSKDLKMRMIVSISFREHAIIALTQKFSLLAITEGSESAKVVSCDGISYNTTSTIVCSSDKSHFIGGSDGTIIEFSQEGNDKLTVLGRPSREACCTLSYDDRAGTLYAGFTDGLLARFTLKESDILEQRIGEDTVLCSLDDLDQTKRLVNLLDVERNTLRIQTSQLLNKYRKKCEREMLAMNNELRSAVEALEKQIEEISSKTELDAAASRKTIETLINTNKRKTETLKESHKKMMTEQIRLHIEKQKQSNDEIQQLRTEYKQIQNNNKSEIETLRNELNSRLQRKAEKLQKCYSKIKDLENKIEDLCQQRAEVEQHLQACIAEEEEKLRQATLMFRQQKIELKANVLIATDEAAETIKQSKYKDNVIEHQNDELNRYKALCEEKDRQIVQLAEEIKSRNAEQSEYQKKIFVYHKGKISLEKSLKQEMAKRKAADKQLRMYEAKIEEAVRNMYKPKALEKNALDLQALLKSKKEKPAFIRSL